MPHTVSDFDITETIGLTRWVEAERAKDPTRFRRFRIFVNSVGVCISTGPEGPSELMPPNYFGISLLDDAMALQDAALLRLLSPVFVDFHQRLVETGDCVEEAPFLLLGQVILAFLGFAPGSDPAALCEQLIAEESRYTGRASPGFLWGCTSYNSLHHRWRHFAETSFPQNAGSESIALVRDALFSPPPSGV